MLTFPLKNDGGGNSFPGNSVCLVCGARVGEIEGYLQLTVGAMFHHKGRHYGAAGPSDKMDAVFSVMSHGPHPVQGKTDDGRLVIGMDNEVANVEIIEAVRGGQADIFFCSKSCLLVFFSAIVDQLPPGWERKPSAVIDR